MTGSFTNATNFLAGTTPNSVGVTNIGGNNKLYLVIGNYIEANQDLHEQIPATQLVFIDSQVENYQSLVAGVLPNTTVVVLDPNRDGIEQISQVLASHQEVNSLHIVSHGAPGRVYLGNSQLSHEMLNRYAWQLMGWANTLSADAQLLLYGCEVAQTEQGMAFVHRLSELTGAVVAASNDLTGSALLGGNWELEVCTGAIASPLVFQKQVMAAYSSVLGKVYLDPSFNTTGKVTTDFNNSYDGGYSITVQSDGKILVAGESDNGSNYNFAIARYNSDGTLDTSFNATGKVTTNFNGSNAVGYSITVQSDGKILVAGESDNGSNYDLTIARYNSNGTLDTSFNTTGKVTTDFNNSSDGGNSITVQSDGKILVGGISYKASNYDFAIARYNSNGTLDTSFNKTGKVTTDFNNSSDGGNSITVQSDGKILLAGTSNNGSNYDFAIARYNSNGTLDTSFNKTGKVTTDFNNSYDSGYSITVQSDSKILLAGTSGDNSSNSDFAIARYNSDGTLDTTFNATGKVTTDFNNSSDDGKSITVQSDGKILLAGTSGDNSSNSDFAIARYNSDGTLDNSFNATGKVTTDFNNSSDDGKSITVQSDGKILVAGDSNQDFAIARYVVNQVPELANIIDDQQATQDSVFNFIVPTNTFTDADVGDKLTYTATLENDRLLPTWLNFNPTTLTFSGTPTNKDVGSLNIKITAKDIAGHEANDVFTLGVADDTNLNIQSITLLTKITGDIFSVKTNVNTKGNKAKLSIKIQSSTANQVNELGVFFVDDEKGTINGIAPGAEGYTQAALSRSQVILSSIAKLPKGFKQTDLKNILEFEPDTKLRFYLVSNSTTQAVLSGKTSFSSVLFSSATNSNTEGEGFSLNFQNFVVTVQPTEQKVSLGTDLQGKNQGELIDLRSVTQSVTANFVVHRDASYDDYVGFYQVADQNGGIDTNGDGKADILVGQAGYAQAAVGRRVAGIDLTVSNQGTANYTGSFGSDSLFAPFIIVDGQPDAFLNSNANKNVYFSFLGANSDKTDHIRLLGNNTFGFEDLPNGGNKSYNDMIVQVNLSLNAG
ncbi:DUF4347 domain-containing protein [Nostoc sp.]|uniref:DUF4347 domain-containing protein n=1 Tax=Nostoc sp. TaxID=1180 RepID=UPI002FF96FCD